MKLVIKIILATSGIILGAGLLISLLTYFQMSGFILKGARGNLDLGGALAAEKIGHILEGREDNLKYLANLLTTRTFAGDYLEWQKLRRPGADPKKAASAGGKLKHSRADLEKFFLNFCASAPYYVDLKIINLEGWEIFHQKSGKITRDFWDVSRTDLFRSVYFKNPGEIYQSNLILENTPAGKSYVVYLGTPVLAGDKKAAVMLAKIDLFVMADSLANHLISPEARLWLLDEAGNLLVHPERSAIGKNISQVNLGEHKQFIKGILLNESGQASIKINEEKYYLAYRPLAFKNWKMLAEIPEKGFLAIVEKLNFQQKIIIIFALVILVILILAIINQEFKAPLRKLTYLIRNASEAEALKLAKKTNREINQLFEALEDYFGKGQNRLADLAKNSGLSPKEQEKLEEKYQKIMDITTAFLELTPKHNLKKTLEQIIEDLRSKLGIKSAAIVLKDTANEQEIISVYQGLKEAEIQSLEELKIISLEVNFKVTPKIKGVLYLSRQDLDLSFSKMPDFLAKLSVKVSQVVREVLHREEKSIVDSIVYENKQARFLKERFFKLNFPEVKDLEFGVFYLPSGNSGGSFFNFISFMGNGYLDLAFGELPGSGLKTAISLGILKGLLRSRAIAATSPQEIVADVNKLIFDEFSEMIPTSLSYNIIDLKNKIVSSVNVGDLYLVYFNTESRRVAGLKSELAGLGSQREMKPVMRKIHLNKGDFLVFLNHGFFAFQEREAPFGAGRLKTILERYHEHSASEIAEKLKEEFLFFIGDKPLAFDMLALFIKVV